jgi:poly-gamma-glutamate synthesis protein (capsule biosynthesis protein)
MMGKYWAIIFFCVPVLAISGEQFSITMGGDFGFNTSAAAPNANGGASNGPKDANGISTKTITPYSSLTKNINTAFNGDINIINLESTVLKELPNDGIEGKRFIFNTHPKGIEHMADLGVDVFTLGNNHIADYKNVGIVKTLDNLDLIAQKKPIQYVGAGRNLDEAKKVKVITKNGVDIAVASIGIIDTSHYFHRANENTPGTLSFRNRHGHLDYEEQLNELKDTQADYKILAIHYGHEGRTSLDPGQREKFLKAVTIADADLIIGHHPHVVRPIEVFNHNGKTRVFAYSLGNLLHLGTGKIENKAAPYNFGILGKLILEKQGEGKLQTRKMEIYPILGTHHTPRSPSREQCQEIINQFNSQIAAQSPNNLRFRMSPSSEKCVGVADINPNSTRSWIEETPTSPHTSTPHLTQHKVEETPVAPQITNPPRRGRPLFNFFNNRQNNKKNSNRKMFRR